MRAMVLVTADEERDPSEYGDHVAEFEAMGRFNEELVKAGVMLAGEGLAPTSQGKRLTFAGDGTGARVLDGPFAEAKEIVGGFWIWQVSSMEEAVEWLKRAPFRGQSVDLRRILEPADFEGQLPEEVMDAEARLRAQVDAQTAQTAQTDKYDGS